MNAWDLDPFIDANDEPWFRLGLDRAIPPLLRQLATEDPQDRTAALGDLDDRIFPGGDLNYASAPVAGFLARLAVHPATDDRDAIVDALEALLSVASEMPESDPFGRPVIDAISPFAAAILSQPAPIDSTLYEAIAVFGTTWSRWLKRRDRA
jgi:hypothetical protein